MIILDASVVIAHTLEEKVHAVAALEILDTEDELAMHPITLAEYLVGPTRRGAADSALSVLDRLGVERIVPTAEEPMRLARLRVDTRLRMPDCCVLVAAQQVGGAVATFDSRLADAARAMGLAAVGA